MTKIGMQKLNIPPKQSASSPSQNLAQAPRATGGTFASRNTSIFGSAKSSGSFGSLTSTNYGIQADRENFATRGATASDNMQRWIAKWDNYQLPKYNFTPNYKFNNNQSNGMNSMMKWMMFGEGIAGIVDAARSNKSEGKGSVKSSAEPNKSVGKGSVKSSAEPDKSVGSKNDNNAVNSDQLYKQLNSTNSFNEIKNIENTLNTKLDSFKESYASSVSSYMDAITKALSNDVKNTLTSNGINLDTAVLKPNVLNISSSSDSGELQTGIELIGQDIKDVDGFINNIPNNLQILSTKLESVKAQLLKANENSNQTAISQLQKQQKDLEAAQAALKTVQEKAEKIKGELIKQQDALKDLKDTHDNIADKKYDLAVEQDKEFQKTAKEIEKKESDIKKQHAKIGEPPKEKEVQKYNAMVAEYNGLVDNINQLKESLSDAGETEFTNSKGKTYTLQFDKDVNPPKKELYQSTSAEQEQKADEQNKSENTVNSNATGNNTSTSLNSSYMRDNNGDYTPGTYAVANSSSTITVKKEALGTKYFDANGKEINENVAKILLRGAKPIVGNVSLSTVPSFQSSSVESGTQTYINGPDAKAQELGTTTEQLEKLGIVIKFDTKSGKYMCYNKNNNEIIPDAIAKNILRESVQS